MSLRFALSTRPFRHLGLDARHLTAIAAAGFDAVSLVAARSHVDYADPQAAARLSQWLLDAGLRLDAVHAPRGTAVRTDRWVEPFSLASTDEDTRTLAVDEVRLAIRLAATCQCPSVIVSLEQPGAPDSARPDSATAARHSLTELARDAETAGVTLALRSGRSPLSTPEALARLIEHDLEGTSTGIAVDYGHAHLAGDVLDAVETAGEFMVAALLCDNHGRKDERLVPGAGTINWDAAMMATQKVGFSGPAPIDVDGPDIETLLPKAAKARERLRERLIAF